MLDYAKIQEAIFYATAKFDGVPSSKPTLLHSIHCGIRLMDNGYDTDMVIAGILHDTVEDTTATVEEIDTLFGGKVASIVAANTKDPSIEDKNKRREELIERCCKQGANAVTVKLADIYDNYCYYKAIKNDALVAYCLELKGYMMKYIQPSDLEIPFVCTTLDEIA